MFLVYFMFFSSGVYIFSILMYVKRHKQFLIGCGAILNKLTKTVITIVIFYLYSATSIIVCGASQHNVIKVAF